MTMFQTEVSTALITDHLHHFLLLAARLQTTVGINLAFPLSGIRLTILVDVCPNDNVWHLSSFHWDRGVTEWTNRHLHVLLVGRGARVLDVRDVVFAENLFAGVTFHGQEIELFAGVFGTMLPQVRELHSVAPSGISKHQ